MDIEVVSNNVSHFSRFVPIEKGTKVTFKKGSECFENWEDFSKYNLEMRKGKIVSFHLQYPAHLVELEATTVYSSEKILVPQSWVEEVKSDD